MSREFDYQDYKKHPIKYRHFKTAVINTYKLPTINEGDHVGIEFFNEIYDGAIHNGLVPVYRAWNCSGEYVGYLYANSLREFVL